MFLFGCYYLVSASHAGKPDHIKAVIKDHDLNQESVREEGGVKG